MTRRGLLTLAGAALIALALLPLAAHASADREGGEGEHHAAPGEPHVNWTNFFGYKDVNEKGEQLEDNEGHMSPPLVFQMINFAIFIGILILVAGPRIKKSMVARHDEVNNALQEAAVLKAEAAKKLEEYGKRIADVDREVDELVRTIRKDAEDERTRLVAEARAQAATLKRDADERIAASIVRARAALETEVVAAAIAAAEAAIARSIDGDDQRGLVERFIVSFEAPEAPKGGPGGPAGGGSPGPAGDPRREKRESEVDQGWA